MKNVEFRVLCSEFYCVTENANKLFIAAMSKVNAKAIHIFPTDRLIDLVAGIPSRTAHQIN